MAGYYYYLRRSSVVECICVCVLAWACVCAAFQCGECDRASCPTPRDCPGGLVMEPCGCCALCGRVENETCGGAGLRGHPSRLCAPGFLCKISARGEGDTITGNEEGHCQVMPTGLEAPSMITCDTVECEMVFPHVKCPEDSMLEGGTLPPPGKCCPEQPSCKCMPCVSPKVTCEEGLIKVKVMSGTESPGQCCDIYECQPKGGCEFFEVACSNVTCEESSTNSTNVTCPADSVLAPPIITQNGCCQKPAGCMCDPDAECPLATCGSESVVRWVRKGKDVPGQCCDVYKCVLSNETICRHAGIPHQDGTSWSIDACTTCVCQKGLTLCSVMSCPQPSNPNCGWMAQPEGECCPVCKGCVDGIDLHLNGASWERDECVTCHCEDGHVYCMAQMCHAACAHPRKVEGICCPVCDEPYMEVTVAPPCPSLANCSLMCPEGLKLSPDDGCPVCQCASQTVIDCELECLNGYPGDSSGEVECDCDGLKEEPVFVPQDPRGRDCALLLDCPHGYKTDLFGNWLCECIELPPIQGPFEPPKDCPSLFCPYGFVVNETGHRLCQCEEPPVFVLPEKPPETEDLCPMLDCEHGLQSDNYGQILCECSEAPTQETPATPEVPTLCPPIDDCDLKCAFGMREDRNGCPKCRCRRCPPWQCHKKCLFGYRINSHSCRICKCLDSPLIPATPAPPVHHPDTPSTRLHCVSVDGQDMEDGEMWYDGCRRCFCYNGLELCSLVTCPSPQCRHPVIRVGSCCPTCPEDDSQLTAALPSSGHCVSHEGSQLVEGETWQQDECSLCICHQGETLCQVEHCPPLLCIHPVRLPGKCCAACPDGSDYFALEPSLPHRHLCVSHSGATYLSGDTWRVGPCQSCLCREGQIHCFIQSCPMLNCEQTVVGKGQCCPVCAELEPQVPMSQVCEHEGSVYGSHESWLIEPCTQCVCYQGHTMCANIRCPVLTHCPHPVRVPGHCCPVCANLTEIEPRRPDRTNNTDTHYHEPPIEKEDHTSHLITVGVLVAVVVLLGTMVILLLFLLLRKRRRRQSKSVQKSNTTQTNGDINRRPKSTNLDYMGVNPLLGDPVKGVLLSDPVKQALLGEDTTKTSFLDMALTVDVKSECKDVKLQLENESLTPLVSSEDVKVPLEEEKEELNNASVLPCSKGVDKNRYSMVDEATARILLDLPDLHCDMNNYRKSL